MFLQKIVENTYSYQSTWTLVFIVFGIMLTGYVYAVFYNELKNLFKAFIDVRTAAHLPLKEHFVSRPISVLLSANFILMISLFILQSVSSRLLPIISMEFSPISFILIIPGVFLIYFTKILLVKILGFVFYKKEIADSYYFIILLTNQMLGILLIPIVIFIAYGNLLSASVLIYSGILILLLGFFIRAGKGIVLAIHGKENWFYIFLYFCTLEILPLLIGIKLLVEVE